MASISLKGITIITIFRTETRDLTVWALNYLELKSTRFLHATGWVSYVFQKST
jgi:hypothetical protein